MCVCVIGSAVTYDPSDSPDGDSVSRDSPLETRHCQNVRVRIERKRGERERRTVGEDAIDVHSRASCHASSIIGDPGLPVPS